MGGTESPDTGERVGDVDDSPVRGRRGVTPVVANVLLVAVVLVLAVVLVVLAVSFLEGTDEQSPVASFEVERGANGEVRFVHTSGDAIDTDRVSVVFGDRSYPLSSYLTADRVRSGKTIGPVYPAGADEVKLVWNGEETSSILYSAAVPDPGSVPQYLRFEDAAISSYDSSQDRDGEYRVTNGFRAITLSNNAWKYVPYDAAITSDTVLAFEFRSDDEGEIHGIGLEDDTDPTSSRVFRLFGTQNWGIDYGDYAAGDGWVRYEIPVGELYAGSQRGDADYLAFVNDLDDGSGTSESRFRNVRVYEPPTPQFRLTVDGTSERRTVRGYGSQDADGAFELREDGETLRLSNNTWRWVSLNRTITDETTVSVEFNSTAEGEIHGIGFETDDSETESRFVRLYGTQNWGTKYGSYGTGDGWQRYEFVVDDQTAADLTGTDISRLVFVNDDDTSDPTAVSTFRNVTVSEGG